MPNEPRTHRTPARRAATVAVCVLAGFMMAASATTSRGTDLRPSRNTDLVGLVQAEARRNGDLTRQLTDLRREVDDLTRVEADQAGTQTGPSAPALDDAARAAALTPVRGPAVTVVLKDAPLNVKPAGVDDDLLVVHQQDIQAVVDALWAGGAEAMTIQGQRVSARTGIKCVGNTVVLDSVPYAPPYVITAIGSQRSLENALASSHALRIYRQYAEAYHLGWEQRREASVTMPGYSGSVAVQWAKPAR